MLYALKNSGHKKNVKRLGRGSGSGRGKTSGRGHKGAGQRAGTAHYIGFEGGNVPYLRKIPKRGFTPARRRRYQIVSLASIMTRLQGSAAIGAVELKEAGLIRDEKKPVKILAAKELEFSMKAVIKADAFSRKAAEVIAKAGGKTECSAR